MRNLTATLAEARRIAEQPTTDRLDGKQGEEARTVVVRLLEETGLDFMEAIRLLDAFAWSKWAEGYAAGNERRMEAGA